MRWRSTSAPDAVSSSSSWPTPPRWRLLLAQFVAAAHEEVLAASVRAERDGVGGVGGGEGVEGRRRGVGVGRRREVVRHRNLRARRPRVGRCAMRGGLLLVCHVALAAWKACPESAIGCAGSCTGTSKCKFCKCRACDVCRRRSLRDGKSSEGQEGRAETCGHVVVAAAAARRCKIPQGLEAAKEEEGCSTARRKRAGAGRQRDGKRLLQRRVRSVVRRRRQPAPGRVQVEEVQRLRRVQPSPITTATDPPPSNAGYALAAAGPVIALVGCFFYARARSPPTTVTGGQFAIEEDR